MLFSKLTSIALHEKNPLYQFFGVQPYIDPTSCVYCKNHCDLQPWARDVCILPAVPRSTQPSTLRGTVNEYQLSG